MDYRWSVCQFALNEASEAFSLEYKTASERLGDVLDEPPYILYSRRNSPVFEIISKFFVNLPLVCLLLPFFESNFENSFVLGILRLFRTG